MHYQVTILIDAGEFATGEPAYVAYLAEQPGLVGQGETPLAALHDLFICLGEWGHAFDAPRHPATGRREMNYVQLPRLDPALPADYTEWFPLNLWAHTLGTTEVLPRYDWPRLQGLFSDTTPPGAVCLHRDTTEPRKDDR